MAKTKLRIERGEMPETLLEIMQKSSATSLSVVITTHLSTV